MERLFFNFEAPGGIRPALSKLRCNGIPKGHLTRDHLQPLTDLGERWQLSNNALNNALSLACGYSDLVVVLTEPCNIAEHVPYEKMFNNTPTLRRVDEALRFAFHGHRSVENTIILDVQPFRSAWIRESEEEDSDDLDREAFERGFKETMDRLRPDCLLVCTCKDLGKEANDLFSSSVASSGLLSLVPLDSGRETLRVPSFHPMYIGRPQQTGSERQQELKKIMREHLFYATFFVAANALAGYRIRGVGIRNLRSCAMWGPALVVLGPEECIMTCQWIGKRDIASPELLARLNRIDPPPKVSNGTVALYAWYISIIPITVSNLSRTHASLS